jgi:hypothetical protein
MTRFAVVGLVVLGSLAIADVARAADSMPLPNGTLKFDKFLVEKSGKLAEPTDGEQVRHLLNAASCACSQADLGADSFGYRLTLSAATGLSRPVDVYVGTNCGDPLQINTSCLKVTSIQSIDTIHTLGSTDIRIPLYQAVNVKTPGACNTATSSVTVWLMVDIDGNGQYEHWDTAMVPMPYTEATVTGVDVKPPPLPMELQASGSESSIDINWKLPTDATDLFHFQALCANADGSPIEGVTIPDRKYDRVSDVCPASSASSMIMLSSTTGPADGAPVDGSVFATLDPKYLCGESAMGATSLKIDNLANGVPYQIALVAIDNYGNFTGTYFSTTVTPEPVTDFWEVLNDRDSAVQGGCLLSTTYGDDNPLTRWMRSFRDDTLARSAAGRWLTEAYYATLGKLTVASLPARILVGIALLPLVALALLWHLLGLPALLALLALLVWRRQLARLWRRWRLLRFAAPAAVAAILLAPALAAADDFTPYWENPAEESALEAGVVKWQVGIRVGPYTPDIDLQFDQNAATGLGPYAQMFGTYYSDDGTGVPVRHQQHVYQILPMLDVDRIVWRGFGQVGVGGSLGYMQKSAYAYASGSSEDDGEMRLRSADKNTFRLIPLAATVTYRLTYADERWGIPVIPYVRAGLAYYMWWIKGPSGSIAKSCDETNPSSCDKAYGGTPGVQASAGLAVRAERVDAAAARSMRNSGIQHAGFYGEVFWGRVDGFGSSSKLWVGDTTWFAGANFEF